MLLGRSYRADLHQARTINSHAGPLSADQHRRYANLNLYNLYNLFELTGTENRAL
jgi:hypothetical protein